MAEFHVSRPLIVIARFVLATLGGFALVGAYLGVTEPGAISPFGIGALAILGATLIGVGIFAPSSWCARVLWFIQ